jgi:hypothetical protein
MTTPIRRVLAAACLIAPFVALLWVPWYARDAPSLDGVPFFYWFQFLWVPASVLLMTAAYLLLHRTKR